MAQNVTITGRTNQTNALIRLFTYEELITSSGKQIATTQSDGKGFFIIEGNVNQTLSARLFVGLESVDMILSPNATYDIEVIVPAKDDNVSYFDKEQPTIRIKKASDKGVSHQVYLSEEIINAYLIEHFNQIYRGRQTRYLDSIAQ